MHQTDGPANGPQVPMFGPPPLITGENLDAYDALLARVSADVAPQDVLEQIWVRDIVDITWELLRLRRMKAGLFNANAYQSLRVVLKPLIDRDFQEQSDVEEQNDEQLMDKYIEENWARRIPAAVRRVDQLLEQAELSMAAVNAETLLQNIEAMERIDRMIAATEARRNATLREIDRHRETLSRPLRRNLEQIDGAEYKVLETRLSKD